MRKIEQFFRKILIYKLIEFATVVSLEYFLIRHIFSLYNLPLSMLFIFIPLFLYTGRIYAPYFSFSRFLRRLEQAMPHDISLLSVYSKGDDRKYGYSDELIQKEKERNIACIDKMRFQVSYLSLALLFCISVFVIIALFTVEQCYCIVPEEIRYDVIPGDISAASGEQIKIMIRHNSPEKAELHITEKDIVLNNGEFYDFVVSDDIEYYFTIGDLTTPRYKINSVRPLVLSNIYYEVTLPEYAGKDTYIVERGDIEVLRGSSLRAVFSFNEDVDTVEVITEESIEIDLKAEERSLEFTAENSFSYRIIARNEYSDITTKFFRVNVSEDQPPSIKIMEPVPDLVQVRKDSVEVKAIITDDLGLKESSLCIFYEDSSTDEVTVNYDSKDEIVQEFTFLPEQDGYFFIRASDRIQQTVSAKKNFSRETRKDVLEKVIEKTDDSMSKYNELKDEMLKTVSENQEKIRDMFLKERLVEEDHRVLRDISEDMQEHGNRLSDIEKDLEEFSEYIKDSEIHRDIFEKISKLREEMKSIQNNMLSEYMNDLSSLSDKEKLDFSDYSKWKEKMDLSKIRQQLEDTLSLMQRAREEAEELAVLQYIEELYKELHNTAVYSSENIFKKDFSILKGIRIRLDSVNDGFLSVSERIEDAGKKDVSSLLTSASEQVFKEPDSCLENQYSALDIFRKLIDRMSENVQKRREKDKQEVISGLKEMYSITLEILKEVNDVSRRYQSGEQIVVLGQQLLKNRDRCRNAQELFRDISKKSFILDSAYFRNYSESEGFLEKSYERGKEKMNISSFLELTEKNMIRAGMHIVDSMQNMQGMDSSTAMEEFMKRMEELRQRQNQFSESFSEYLRSQNPLQQFLDHYRKMQQSIRDSMQSLQSEMFSEELDAVSKEMAEIERKIEEKRMDEKDFENEQEKIRKLFRKMMTVLSEKMDKKEYAAEKSEITGSSGDRIPATANERESTAFTVPEDFPDISERLKRLIKDYINSF